MRTKKAWHYLCNRCGKDIVPEDPTKPSASLYDMQVDGKLFIFQSRKGNLLHYCSRDCKDKHFNVGVGQPEHTIRRPGW